MPKFRRVIYRKARFVCYRSRRQIKRAILENEFLGNLEEEEVEVLVSAMYPKQIPPGTLVIREGDIGKLISFLSRFISMYPLFSTFIFQLTFQGRTCTSPRKASSTSTRATSSRGALVPASRSARSLYCTIRKDFALSAVNSGRVIISGNN